MVIFLYGEDSFRSQNKLKELKNRFQKEVDATGSSIALIEGNEVDLAYIRKVVLAPALFAKERFVIFKNFFKYSPTEELQQEVIDLLKQYTGKKEDNILVFWEQASEKDLDKKTNPLFKFLKKQKFSQEFKPMSGPQLAKWIQTKVIASNCQISNPALKLLQEMVGGDIWLLNNELDKLIAYKSKGTITEEDVRLLVAGSEDESVYHLLDMIVAKDQAGALIFSANALRSPDGVNSILNILKWQTNVVANIKGLLQAGVKTIDGISKASGLHQFVVKKNRAYAEKMSNTQIKALLEKTMKLEMDLRKQSAPPKVLLTNYIMDLVE